jgi:hypothetical protein
MQLTAISTIHLLFCSLLRDGVLYSVEWLTNHELGRNWNEAAVA